MRRLTSLTLLLVAALGQAQERLRDVIYMKEGGCAFTLDVFKPAKANHKAVVWLVSGGWFSSHEAINADLAKPLNDAGYTVFEVVHGSQPRYKIPEIIPQVQHSIRYIRANAKTWDIDPNAIGVSGMSAGGHLSLMIGGLGDEGKPDDKDPVNRVSDKVQAVVAFMPPTDFLNWGKEGAVPFKMPQMLVFMPAFGVTPQTPEDTMRKLGHDLSPINTINPNFPPTLIVHGDKDPLVPLQQAQTMDSAFDAAKLIHKLVVVPGGGHDLKTLLGGFPALLEWFNSHLTAAGA